jgi:hypothetical protein
MFSPSFEKVPVDCDEATIDLTPIKEMMLKIDDER